MVFITHNLKRIYELQLHYETLTKRRKGMNRLRKVVVDLIMKYLVVLLKYNILTTRQVEVLLQIILKLTYPEIRSVKASVVRRGHPNKKLKN